MTLMEKYKNRKPPITKEEREAIRNSPEMKRYSKFLDMCERLQGTYEDIVCKTVSDVFDEIEKRKVDMSDIISREEYAEFKRLVIIENHVSFPVGKPDRIYDLNNPKDYADWRKSHPNESMTF